MARPEMTELRQMEIDRDNALGLARGFSGEVEYLKNDGAENAKIAQLFRDHLDNNATDQEWDTEWENQARRIMWNEEDAKALKAMKAQE